VSDRTAAPGDLDARAGLMLAIAGVALLPITLLAIGTAPQAARAAIFLLGLAAVAAVSIWGGVRGRRALTVGTTRRPTAMVAGILGLLVGITSALMALLSLAGLVL
jgi:hypothetical protein